MEYKVLFDLTTNQKDGENKLGRCLVMIQKQSPFWVDIGNHLFPITRCSPRAFSDFVRYVKYYSYQNNEYFWRNRNKIEVDLEGIAELEHILAANVRRVLEDVYQVLYDGHVSKNHFRHLIEAIKEGKIPEISELLKVQLSKS